MKKTLLIAIVFIISLVSCKKNETPVPDPEVRKPDVLIKDITTSLSGADSISTFTDALKTLKLSAEDVAQGLTVFAPLNETNVAQTARLSKIAGLVNAKSGHSVSVTANSPLGLTDSVLRDHIVKGIFRLTDLTDGKILTGLSGKQLKVSKSGDEIWINGVQIGGKQIVSTNNEVIYVVKTVLSGTTITDDLQSTSLEITVWDASKWTVAKPKGEVAANANVELYKTQKDYADSIPAYVTTSNGQGKAIFKSIVPGIYYIKVLSEGKSNIFNKVRQEGFIYGFANTGIFQTQVEVNAAPTQNGAEPGGFKWQDSNQDGIINDNDRIKLPYENATAINGILKKVEVTIGLYKVLVPKLTEQEFLTAFTQVENNVANWQKRLAVVDGLLSHEAVIDSIPLAFRSSYEALGTFAFTPSNAGITQIWQDGYAAITTLNNLQQKAPITMTSRAEKMNRLKATRAYIYLQLLTYFENIPLAQEGGNLVNTNKTAVINFINAELESAADSLSLAPSGAANLNGLSVKVLQARIALLEKKYAKAADLTTAIINSSQYALANLGAQFNTGSSEIIWDNSANIDLNVKTYFYNRPTLPYLRLTEVYLISIEANLGLNNIPAAQIKYNPLVQRLSKTGTVSQSVLRGLWKSEMRREGVGFANMIRWETTQSLNEFGFTAKNVRLPIPLSVVQANPGIVQNAGY